MNIRSLAQRSALGAIAVLAFTHCSDTPTGTIDHPNPARSDSKIGINGIQRWSCYDPDWPQCSNVPPAGDPAPEMPGVFLGSSFSWSACTASGGMDVDGVVDFCEFQLALAFRPLLAIDPWDEDATREPYWAARREGATIKIFYAFAYHWDNGIDSPWCAGDYAGWCLGHPGDAEHVKITISFDSDTQHWVTDTVYFAAHAGTLAESSETRAWTSVEFPTKSRHYPRVWVSRDKHGSYATRSSCNNGGALDLDTCENNQDTARAETWEQRNLGSSTYQFVNYTTTTADPYTYTGEEYFWDVDKYFCGWDGDSLNHNRANCSLNTAYGTLLGNHGF